MNTRRKPLTKKVRFEVFKRDHFTCQYCGRMAPDVILEVDHINPVAEGGTNDLVNLITSCRDCNRGKGKRKLSDSAEVKKQQEMLKELASKREQIEMMVEWRKELINAKQYEVECICDIFKENTEFTLTINEYGKRLIYKLIEEYGFDEVAESTIIYLDKYLEVDGAGNVKLLKPLSCIGIICLNRKRGRDDPSYHLLNKITYIASKNFHWKPKWLIRTLVKDNIKTLKTYEYILDHINEYLYLCWTDFENTIIKLGKQEKKGSRKCGTK